MFRWLALVPALSCAACTGGYVFVPRPGAPPAAPKASDCALHVVELWPYPGYADVGILEWDGGVGVPRTTGDLYDKARPAVCEAGADVVLARPNDAGKYVRASVLRRLPGPPMPPPAPMGYPR